MKKSLLAFVINHTVITLLLGIILLALKIIFPAFPIPESVYIIFLFFYFFVPVVHGFLLKVSEKRAQVFIRTFMVMTFFKLFVYLGFVSILLLNYRTEAIGIIVVFASLYFINLAHEILALLKHFGKAEKELQ